MKRLLAAVACTWSLVAFTLFTPACVGAAENVDGAAPGIANHSVRVRPNGSIVGRVTLIDANQLTLLPVPDESVLFIQNGRVVARTRTGADGRFTVQDLTPHAVYSVVVQGPSTFAAISVAVLSADGKQVQADGDENTVALVQADGDGQNVNDILSIAAIPTGDLPSPPPAMFPAAPAGGPGAGGGGGGGGGHHLFLPIVIPIIDDDDLASPFAP